MTVISALSIGLNTTAVQPLALLAWETMVAEICSFVHCYYVGYLDVGCKCTCMYIPMHGAIYELSKYGFLRRKCLVQNPVVRLFEAATPFDCCSKVTVCVCHTQYRVAHSQ